LQFALLEAFETSRVTRHFGAVGSFPKRYDRKPVHERLDDLSQLVGKNLDPRVVNAYKSMSNFRNILAHEGNVFCGFRATAMDYYVTCQCVAVWIDDFIEKASYGPKIENRRPFWRAQLLKFDREITFRK
jgi:hypothetical protein